MVSFKKQCIELRRRGWSLNQIVVHTKRPKTSVYFHIRNIPLSKTRQGEIRRAAKARILAYSKKIIGKSKLNRHPIPFHYWSPPTISLVAHLLFDGEIKYGGCVYTNRNMSLLNRVRTDMNKIYPFQPKEYESVPGVYKIAYFNVELENYLREKSQQLLREITGLPEKHLRTFLRAFFDDEGSIYFIGKRKAVRGYQHNAKILFLIQRLLRGFGIKSKVDKKYNEVTITRKENIARFAKEINFSKGVRINGKRSNSIWKKSLEKREILRRALASYITR